MATTAEDINSKAEMVEIEPKTGVAIKLETSKEEKVNGINPKIASGETGKEKMNCENGKKPAEEEPKNEKVPKEATNGKEPNGLRKKSMLGLGIKIYGFGIYADDEKLKDILWSKIGKAPAKPTKEMYQVVIDSDLGMMVRLVIVFSNLTMSMIRKNFDEGLGASIKKLTGVKNEELTKRIMGEASDDIKLTSGSVIEISRSPGFILQTKVKGEIVSTVESELLCRAYIHMYLGDDPFDKEAKENFGMSMLSLF
ncbi:unnamed protein product [Ilex paraguariensis]|uniref:Chalcone isomerase domain-containing protein n=1 Tax=Ilex paraguariensis TaxID=185542 RepID=A0ABC8SQK7_9AQUA